MTIGVLNHKQETYRESAVHESQYTSNREEMSMTNVTFCMDFPFFLMLQHDLYKIILRQDYEYFRRNDYTM